MKILVTGNGKLAQELCDQYYDDIVCFSKNEMDIRVNAEVSEKLFIIKPDVVIHTAALTKPMSINGKDVSNSIETNIVGTANIALACYNYNIRLVYISTDYMYVNEKQWNNYAKSKRAGELATLMLDNSLVLRCALTDIPFRHSIAFKNVYRNAITHKDIAKIILELSESKKTGIINIGGKLTSMYDFVKKYDSNISNGEYYGTDVPLSINLNESKYRTITHENT